MRTGNESYWFEGNQQGNFSLGRRDTFDPSKNYVGVRIQQGVPVLDRDWNELEDIRRYQEIILRRYLGDGPLNPPDYEDFKVTANGGMSLTIGTGRFLVDGVEVQNTNSAYSITAITPTTTPPMIYVYLEATFCEVTSDGRGGTQKNGDLLNADAGVETCIRHTVTWNVKSTDNVNDTNSAPPYYRSLLATIAYTGSTITQDQIMDSRSKLNLLQSGDLDCQKVVGPLEIGNGAFLVGDLDKTLQVKFLNSAGTGLTSPYFTLSPGGAIIEGGLTANGDPSATPNPIRGLTVNDGAIINGGLESPDGATIEGGLTANGDDSDPVNPILGLTVTKGATVSGGLTIDGSTLTLANGATISGGGFDGGAGTFTKGLTVSNDTPGTGLMVSNGASISDGLTLDGGELSFQNGALITSTLTISGMLTVDSEIRAYGGLLLPPCTLSIVSEGPASLEIMFKENDVSGVENGGEFAWLAINNSTEDGSSPPVVTHNHRISLGFKPDGATNFGEVFYVKSDGTFPGYSSDQIYKTNIATLTDVLQKIDQIRGVSFDWNDLYKASHYGAPQTRQIGMIAQEVQVVFPELVEEVALQDRTFLGLDYQRFTAILVQAVKELKAQNETLSDRVKALEAPTKAKAKKVTNNEKSA
ncbi:MAG TPA: tail fiber domain-containing protein [Methanothrix sp.]|nr:tail fiber domain-containing protein [Methanothrix sp.]